MRWICAGRYGCRSSNWSNFPAGPSNGIGYGVGFRQYQAYSPFSSVTNFPRRLWSHWSSSCCSYMPLVDACQTSIVAFGIGFFVFASVTVPCIYTCCAPGGLWNSMLAPFSLTGWSCLKKGPRIALCVATSAASEAFLYVISSTNLRKRVSVETR